MADKLFFPATLTRELPFTRSQLLAVLNTDYGQARPLFLHRGRAVGPLIGRPMAKLWPFRTSRQTKPMLGSPCFRSLIQPRGVLRHRQVRASITALLSRLTAQW